MDLPLPVVHPVKVLCLQGVSVSSAPPCPLQRLKLHEHDRSDAYVPHGLSVAAVFEVRHLMIACRNGTSRWRRGEAEERGSGKGYTARRREQQRQPAAEAASSRDKHEGVLNSPMPAHLTLQ